jgi:hypothetical protein
MTVTGIDVERELVRAALHAIVERNNGVLNPTLVLDAARNEAHVLHRFFEWDDGAAADAYRLAQVGALVRRVRFPVVRANAATREVTISTTRGYQSRPSMRRAAGGYERIDTILADTEKRAELVANVLRELIAYRKRYAEISELQAVWIAVDDVAQDTVTDLSSPPAGDETRPGAAG